MSKDDNFEKSYEEREKFEDNYRKLGDSSWDKNYLRAFVYQNIINKQLWKIIMELRDELEKLKK